MTKARNIAEFADDLSVSNGEVSIADLKPSQSMMFRNKIINGDMQIDQRNAGSSVVLSNANNLPVDRWRAYAASGSGHTAQQSTDVPSGVGFSNSVKLTVGTGASPAGSNLNIFYHVIEGYNISDLMFGSTNAKFVTLSFWVKSTGLSYPATFSASLQDGAIPIGTGIPKEYTISTSNTWEYKTLTFIGDVNTGSTYSNTNGKGLHITFDLGSGSDYEGSANVWSSGNIKRTSSSVKLIETSGATLYITGVQLEEGSVATPFEHRPYGLELGLCQRYYEKFEGAMYSGDDSGSGNHYSIVFFKVEKRDVPTTAYSHLYDTIQLITKQKLSLYRSNYNTSVGDLQIIAEL